MQKAENVPVAATAAVIDPASMAVVWTNHPVAATRRSAATPVVTLDQVVPLAAQMGVPEALRAVAETGVAQHLSADVVAMSRAAATLSVSIYRLPDGKLLLLAGDTWRLRQDRAGGSGERRPGRRAL